MTKKPKKQFIAGARCPKCNDIDTTITYQLDGLVFRECVECGFKDQMLIQPHLDELDTRVNKNESPIDQKPQVVRIIDTPKN